MIKEYKLTTCGLSCDLCDANTTKVQDSANYLLKVFEDPMFLGVVSMTNPKFKQEAFPAFKQTLELLKNFPPCPGCQEKKECVINQCTKEKEIVYCSECEFLDYKLGSCKAPPKQSVKSMMPPAPLFFQGLAKRYRNWNIKNLKSQFEGKHDEINSSIEKMIKDGKSSRDIIDFSVNLFESME
ncbi:MAG: DUF3795 domain-containing protein [Candidatus Hodarchaeota archaeon]